MKSSALRLSVKEFIKIQRNAKYDIVVKSVSLLIEVNISKLK